MPPERPSKTPFAPHLRVKSRIPSTRACKMASMRSQTGISRGRKSSAGHQLGMITLSANAGRIPASGRDHQRPDCRQDKLRRHGRPQRFGQNKPGQLSFCQRAQAQQAWEAPGEGNCGRAAYKISILLRVHYSFIANKRQAANALALQEKTRRQARWPFHFAADGSHLNRHRRATATIPARARQFGFPDLMTGLPRENPANSARKASGPASARAGATHKIRARAF